MTIARMSPMMGGMALPDMPLCCGGGGGGGGAAARWVVQFSPSN
jgi:hypothetical protein